MATSASTGGRLWQNGRMKQSYDRLGPCLGSGGMGSVWAARVSDEYVGESSGCAGSWRAVKAIPVEVKPGERDAGGLHTGLRECLSTFRDLNQVHVVRYECYWLEEPAYLPEEIRQFCERGRSSSSAAPPPARAKAAAAAPEVQKEQTAEAQPLLCRRESDASDALTEALATLSVQSLRFQEPPDKGGFGGGGGYGCGSFGVGHSDTSIYDGCSSYRNWGGRMSPYGSASVNLESCGFVWEPASELELPPTPSSPSGKVRCGRVDSNAALVAPGGDAGVDPKGRRGAGAGGAVDTAENRPPECVVLLIEMELMGPPPGDGPTSATEERSTLRTWLQSRSRTVSDAADVFGALMLSVRHIHRKRIVHADLKPDNIFCVVERSKVTAVRIGDFGLAGENQLFRQFSYGVLKRPTALGGTPGYVAPEILKAERNVEVTPCSDKVDIYACAVILLELLLLPFRTHMERAKCMERCCDHKVFPDFVYRLSKTKALLQEMLEHDPMMRLSAEEVCKRFEKEVRKELCRSRMQQCCSPEFMDWKPDQSSSSASRPAEPPVQKGRNDPKVPQATPPVPHRKHNGKKGRRRT